MADPVRGFTHFLGYIEQPRPPCCTPAWHCWALARANRSFIAHQGHAVARSNLPIEDTCAGGGGGGPRGVGGTGGGGKLSRTPLQRLTIEAVPRGVVDKLKREGKP